MIDGLEDLDDDRIAAVRRAAQAARSRARCRHSGFAVGAAITTAAGRVFAGCNVESASYGLTMCAERSAICAWATATDRDSGAPDDDERISHVVIDTCAAVPTPPCGACRQWLYEFARGAVVISFAGQSRKSWRVLDLLPDGFDLSDVALDRSS